MTSINLLTWLDAREVKGITPKHFVLAKTRLTAQSLIWIEEKLAGRYSLVSADLEDLDYITSDWSSYNYYPAFENPSEAVLYELTWS